MTINGVVAGQIISNSKSSGAIHQAYPVKEIPIWSTPPTVFHNWSMAGGRETCHDLYE
jgi:hypothetical protein